MTVRTGEGVRRAVIRLLLASGRYGTAARWSRRQMARDRRAPDCDRRHRMA